MQFYVPSLASIFFLVGVCHPVIPALRIWKVGSGLDLLSPRQRPSGVPLPFQKVEHDLQLIPFQK